MEKAIVADQISKDYWGKPAVSNLSFSISSGAIHGLLGPNGAGKSTTMKILAGLLKASSGKIESSKNLKVGILTENPALYPEMKVNEFLIFCGRLFGLDKLNAEKEAAILLSDFNLTKNENKLIAHLSKGFKQRVAIASCLITKPDLLILDEPTVGLDPQSVLEIREIIKNLKHKYTVLISSHILHEMNLLCDEVTILHEGKVKATGLMSEVEKRFGQYNVIECKILNSDKSKIESLDVSGLKLIEVIEGAELILIFENQTQNDLRAKLSQALISKGCSLLSLKETPVSLESIFFKATGGNS